jgi:conjugative relaxase-like TrwC/TraI family protein
VEEVALTRLLDRQHPRTGAALPRPRRGRPPEVDGFDLMFSVPKSASVLFGLGGPRARGAVVRVQQAAVEEAMRYLDREACLVRVGPERELQRGGGLVGAAFEHRTSRAGDPQLHTHVLVANGTFRGGGAWVALDGTAIYHHARAAGHIHEAAFRRALALELGVEWGRAHNGIADVGGFSAAQLRAFSTRAGEIDVYMVEHGWGGGEARQIAALRTREAKDYDVAPEMLLPEWRERARAVGLDDPTLRAVLDRERYRPLDAAAKAEIADRLAGTGGLTAQASSFDRRDVICAFAGVARQGATLGEIEAFADAFLADRRVVALVGGGRGRRSDRDAASGRWSRGVGDGGRDPLQHARAARGRARGHRPRGRRARGGGGGGRAGRGRAGARGAADDRPRPVPDGAAEGHRVHVVVGPPGTGKTFALDAAREAWEASGYVVVGAAVAREAARNLEEKAAIRSTSVLSLRIQLDLGGEYGLGPRTVVIVDEAGMLPTRDLHDVVEHASAAGAAVVLVGDPHQLPEIDTGGAFRGLVIRTDPIVLTENRRQRHEWGRRMLELIRGGHVRRGLELASDAGAVHVAATAQAAGAQLVGDWWQAREERAARRSCSPTAARRCATSTPPAAR